MKKIIVLSLFVMMLTTAFTSVGQTNFEKLSFKKACEKAIKENKLVFVDFYFNGCHPCLQMKKKIFPMQNVGEFMNKNFINLSYNIEHNPRYEDMAREACIQSYPGYAFYDPKTEEVLHVSKGYKEAEQMIEASKRALNPKKGSTFLLDEYYDGNEELDLLSELYKYLKEDRFDKMAKKVHAKMIELYGLEQVNKKLN